MDYNPYLQSPRPSSSEEGPEKGNLEQSDGVENIIHQTRNASPTAYEDKLGQALEKIFDEFNFYQRQ